MRWLHHVRLWALASAICTAHAGEPSPIAIAPADAEWSIRLAETAKLDYRGAVSYDGAGGGSGGMLYPAPNLGGFLVAVITHTVLVESSKSGEKARLQAEADKVLLPYAGILEAFDHQALLDGARRHLTQSAPMRLANAAAADGGWSIVSAPVFAMTQDRRALVLDNTTMITGPGVAGPGLQFTVRVVSAPVADADATSYWSSDDGAPLKQASMALLAAAIDMAVAEASARWAGSSGTQKTVRYMEGGTEKMERAELLEERCDRMVIRTLRGWLMAVPTKASSCTPSHAASAPAS